MRILLLLLWVALLPGCATTTTKPFVDPPPAPAGMATLVAFREAGVYGSFTDRRIFINDEIVAALPTASYTYIYVRPGRLSVTWHVFDDPSPATRNAPAEVTARAGETYFFKTGVNTFSVWVPGSGAGIAAKNAWGFVEPTAAREELARYTFVARK